jgi:pimeloyl-ACP methyl ester carboxylesterase
MKLFFRRMGQGNPVVILHGFLGLSDNWVTFGRQMSGDFEVFIPDLRNHGQSPHDPHMDYPVLVGDLHEMIGELDLKKVRLIGHSLGGKVAMGFALLYPDLVEKLVIVDIAPKQYPPNMEHLMLIDAMNKVDFAGVRSRSDIDKQLQPNVHSLKLRQFLLKNVFWKDNETLDWRLNLPALTDSLPFILQDISTDKVFPKPVLLIRGGLSNYFLDEDLPEMIKQFPRTSVQTIANASHWVHADAPGEFYDRVHEFLL